MSYLSPHTTLLGLILCFLNTQVSLAASQKVVGKGWILIMQCFGGWIQVGVGVNAILLHLLNEIGVAGT